MNEHILTPTKNVGMAFNPAAVYLGTVSRKDDSLQRVWVRIGRYFGDSEIGPAAVVGTLLPSVGDRVACMFVEGKTDNLIILGTMSSMNGSRYANVLKVNDGDRPVNPVIGDVIVEKTSGALFEWNGSSWQAITGTQGPQGYQGTQGFQGVQGNQGFQGVQGAQGNQGFQGFQGTQGVQGFQGTQGVQGNQGFQGFQGNQGTQGFQGNQGTQGFQGTQGTQGAQGAQGALSGNSFAFTFSTTTTDADPGNGTVRFNNLTYSSVTQIFVDLLDSNGTTVTNWLDSLDDATNTVKGFLLVQSRSAPANWVSFKLTSVTTATGYRKLGVTYVATAGTLTATAGDTVISFAPAGDQGAQGAQGTQGTQGVQGAQGTQGAQGAQGATLSPSWSSWTPRLNQDSNKAIDEGATVTYAKYIRVGYLVTVRGYLTITGTGTAGQQIRIYHDSTLPTFVSGPLVGTALYLDQGIGYNFWAIRMQTDYLDFIGDGDTAPVTSPTIANTDLFRFEFSYETTDAP